MIYLIFRSQTEALKASRLLEGAGIRGLLTKPPRQEGSSSCEYAIRILENQLEAAKRRMQETNFVPCKIRADIP